MADAPLVTLIVTAMRSHPPAANAELARTAGEFGGPVVGFDLAGPEAAWPAPPHALAFVAAREAGLALTAHAGEVAGAQRVREVLDFGVRRVAHGVTAIEDPALLDALRARDITLDLCPTSNVQAGIVPLAGRAPACRAPSRGRERDGLDGRPHRDRDHAQRGARAERGRPRPVRRGAVVDRAERVRARLRVPVGDRAAHAPRRRMPGSAWSRATIS